MSARTAMRHQWKRWQRRRRWRRRERRDGGTSCLLWPFVALWRLLTGIIGLTGRFVAIVIGVVLMIVGLLVSLTIIGAIVGIPLALLGLLLVVRGLA